MAEIGVNIIELTPTKGGYNFIGNLVNRDFVTIVGFVINNVIERSELPLVVGKSYIFNGYLKDCKKRYNNRTHLTQLKVVSFKEHPKCRVKDVVNLTAWSERLLDSGVSINEKKYTDLEVRYLSSNLLRNYPLIRVWEPATKALKFFTRGQLVVISAYITNNIETPDGVTLLIVPSQLTFLKNTELQYKI